VRRAIATSSSTGATARSAALHGVEPLHFGNPTGKLVGDTEGRFVPCEIPGSEHVLQADLLLLAHGFQGLDRTGDVAELAVRFDSRGDEWTDENWSTGVPDVFAPGDPPLSQSLLFWAIKRGGRRPVEPPGS